MGLPGKEIGPFHVLPLYRMFLIGNTADRFPREAQHITYTGYEEVDGTPATVIKWEHDAESLLAGLRITNATPGSPKIPVTAWVSRSENLVLRIKVDLSAWAGQLVSGARDVPLTGLVITETHRGKVRPPSEAAAARFTFEPPADVVPVHRLRLPTPDLSALSSAKRQFARFIPPRLAQATPDLIDLSEYYNASLALGWHPGMDKNDLASLPTGILQLGGRVFDVRGIIQLSGRNLARAGGRYPERINGVRIRQNCRQLHFLHASGWTTHDGTRIGTYVVRWADGKQEEIPILYGQDVRDWNADSDGKPVERAKLAWSGMNEAKRRLRLFMTTWENPYPETQIFSIDYISTMADAAPFLVAISAE
jgi:hypothetical protein